jgi:mutator protein MutT
MDIIDVAAGLVFRDGRLLITQRKARTHLAGLWEFPGGKREAPESFEECLVRELREELGIEVSVGPLIESLTHAYPEKTVRLNFYGCDWLRGEPQTLGCADFKWVDAEQLGEFQFPPADERLLDRLRSDDRLWTL